MQINLLFDGSTFIVRTAASDESEARASNQNHLVSVSSGISYLHFTETLARP